MFIKLFWYNEVQLYWIVSPVHKAYSNNYKNSSLGKAFAPIPNTNYVVSWQSIKRNWFYRQKSHKAARATLLASDERENIDSPQNTLPKLTPYSPPTKFPSKSQVSTECTNPS